MISKNAVASNYLLSIISTDAEKEVERFLRAILKGSPFAGKTHAVGGYVRDQYLSILKNDPSIEAKDLDIVVEMEGGAERLTKYIYNIFNSLWNKMKRYFKGVTSSPVSTPRQMGASYPIWQITFKDDINYKGEIYHTKGAVIEFADTMKETYPDPNSRQRKTEPATLDEDIKRRDFTTNMLLKDLTTGEIEDLTGVSKQDIEKGVLRGHPQVSLDQIFNDDPLRMLRIIRFQAKYGWHVPKDVIRTVKRNAERIGVVSSERIMGELEKVMKIGKLKQAIKLMHITGLLEYVLPEVEALKGVKQNPKHHQEGDVFKHTMMVLEQTPPGIENQLAALLHDIGKPSTTTTVEDEIKSLGHEDAGEKIAEAILKRLKFDNKTIDEVTSRVKNHMRPHHLGDDPTPKALRKFIREVGDEMVDAILDLARADETGKIPPTDNIPDLKKKIEEIRKSAPVQKKSLLSGKEVMDLLGLKTGPEVGNILKYVEDLQDDYANKGQQLSKEDAQKEILKKFKKV
jgi:putative nucleotidyltransferase with HDIG domain